MKEIDYESLKEVWEMKENAFKAYIESGKDYLEYINEATNDFIKENHIQYRIKEKEDDD
jgi:hypothetical protein